LANVSDSILTEAAGANTSRARKVVIRRATAADAPGFTRMFEYPGAYSGTLQLPWPSSELWAGRLASPADERISLVALIDDEIVGQASLHLEKNMRRRHAASVGIGVADPFAGQGIGTLLMAELVKLADNWLHLLRLELTVFVDNAGAQALYRKFGFEVEGRHRAYAMRDGVLMDVVAMARLHPNQPKLPER
jgi:putative acetyltransferase